MMENFAFKIDTVFLQVFRPKQKERIFLNKFYQNSNLQVDVSLEDKKYLSKCRNKSEIVKVIK